MVTPVFKSKAYDN